MGESFFASEPRSLRMDRRSPEAARLREAVSKKLLDFLGNYSDEVLAEYIVVLVCNGKHQTQARDDLQAFLGEESGTFVSWLWNYLSEEFFEGVTPEVSDPKAKKTTKNNNSLDSEQKTNMLTDHHSHSIGPPKVNNGTFEPPSYHENSDHFKPIQVSERLKSLSPHLDDLSTEVNKERLKADDSTLHKNSGSKSGNFTGPAKNITSSIKCSHEVEFVGKQALHCVLQNRKIQKISSSSVPSQHLPEPMAEQAAIGLQSVIAEEHQLRPLPSTIPAETRMLSNAADDLSHPTARLRGNVWDRLGRPHAHTQRSIKEERSFNLDFINSGKLDNQGEESQNPMLTGISQVVSSTRQSYAVDRGDSEGISFKVSGDIRSDKVNNTSSLKRKIEESEFNGAKGNYFQVPNSKATVVSHQVKKDAEDTPVKNTVPTSTTLPANSKSQSRTDGGNANQKPMQDDMLAVKSRIQQIEMDMLKLRSKQVGWSTDGKQNMSSVQNFSEEGIESRTVLVANVHFAATKESLISHFGKCGAIAKVIMLTDAVTGLPKGAAYLVFAHKESVDKAISLSGTSFFSRILKVIRKVEVPPDYLVPSQPSLKQQQQPFYHQPYGKNPLPKPHTSSHLQWRRDQRSSGENSLPAPSNGLGSSNSVE